MTDFIIVGRGLAATVLAHTFFKKNISFKIIGDTSLSNCSNVAAGIWNPIVFKRMTKSWLADELVPYLNEFYSHCELITGKKLITQRPIIKPYTEDQEKLLWLKKSESELENFTDSQIHNDIPEALKHCHIPNGFGVVKQSGNLNVRKFLEESFSFFHDFIIDEVFDYSELNSSLENITYKKNEAANIIFCEGHLIKRNPFFNWIPLKPAKGELFTISAPKLTFQNTVLNRNGFLMDTGSGIFKAGATYAWDDFEDTATIRAAEELHQKIKHMINCPYKVLKHEAGIRPSSIDRRPIVGAHPHHKNLFLFNGLGTKGVMLAPFFAENFVNFYLQKEELHNDVNVKRFYHLYDARKNK